MTRRVSKRAARQVSVPAPKAPDLAQQKTDFTAEGAPPPGRIGASVPETPEEGAKQDPRPPFAAR